MEGQHVILYLDEIDKVSFSFKIYQSAVVKKTKPAAVTVYDYYETGKETDWRQKGVLYGESHLLWLYALQHTPEGSYAHNKARLQHWELRALLFSNSAWVLLRPAESWTIKNCKTGPTLFIENTGKSYHLQL